MNDETEHVGSQDSDGSVPSIITDTFGDLVTGIPAPVRKNALKAFGRLCTAAVEYPIALIESAIAEKRAEAQARIKLIDSSATQIADQMRIDPKYARAAAGKFAQKIIRERVNIDDVTKIAADELKAEYSVADAININSEASPISEDWLNAFETEAAQMSSERMQHLFGKILAGEIRKPSSYSIKAIRLMAQLDGRAASLFHLLCSLSVSLRVPMLNQIVDARVVSMGNAASNSLQAYGLSFGSLNVLQEYGLIIADYNSYSNYQAAVVHENNVIIPINFQNKNWALVPKATPASRQVFNISGVMLSQVGKELFGIVDIENNEQYTKDVISFFDNEGMIMFDMGSA